MTVNSENRLQQGFVLVLLAIVITVFLWMIRNFLTPLVLAAIFAGLLYPFYCRLRTWLGGRRVPASVLTLIIAVLAIGLPVVGIIGMVVNEALNIGQQLEPVVKDVLSRDTPFTKQLTDWLPFTEKLAPYRETLLDKFAAAGNYLGSWLLSSITNVTQDTFGFLLGLFVLLYAMFFFFIYGAEMLHSLKTMLPLSAKDRDLVLDRGLTVTLASLKGILLVGALQGTLVGLAFWVSDIHGPVFWGAMVFLLSAIPGLGAPLIWVPAVVYLIATGHIGGAIGLTLWGVIVVGLVDNIVRPMVVGQGAKLPDIVILVSILGGIATFGPVGIIIGPIIAGVLDTVLNIYKRTFADKLPA
ncbi:MAG: AI-2E family transporter [Desulfurivibrionaceae bacterium]